jgi:hypothetical protein
MVRHAVWALSLFAGLLAAEAAWAQGEFGIVQQLQGEGGEEYRVRPRDTFAQLCERLSVSPRTLAAANDGSQVVRAGQWLRVPALPSLPQGPDHASLLRRLERAEGPGPFARGLAGSPLERWSRRVKRSLARQPDGRGLLPGESGTPFAERLDWERFPVRGQRPEAFVPFTLDFLHPEVSHACVVVGRQGPEGAEARWHGRAPLEHVEWGGGAHHLAGLVAVSALNRWAPQHQLGSLRLRGAGESQRQEVEVREFLIAMAAQRDGARAESLARLLSRRSRQAWSVGQTGHPHDLSGSFADPLFAPPVLIGQDARPVLTGRLDQGALGANRPSAYDLVRLTAMAAWHPHLTRDQRLAATRGDGLALVLESMAHDRARPLDLALSELGLLEHLEHLAVVSSSGWDRDPASGDHRASYVVALQADDTRRHPPVQRRFVFALTAQHADPLRLEARLTHEVVQLTRWLFTGELR